MSEEVFFFEMSSRESTPEAAPQCGEETQNEDYPTLAVSRTSGDERCVGSAIIKVGGVDEEFVFYFSTTENVSDVASLYQAKVTIGRGKDMALPLPSRRELSRRHCTLSFLFNLSKKTASSPTLAAVEVRDEGALNGTCLNGMRLLPLRWYPAGNGPQHTIVMSPLRPVVLTMQLVGAISTVCHVIEVVSTPSHSPVKRRASKKAAARSPKALKKNAKVVPQSKVSRAIHKRLTATTRENVSPALSLSGDGTSVCGPPTTTLPVPLYIVTTGMRLNLQEHAMCKTLNIVVNPPPLETHKVTFLVVESPLVRSIKLMCAIPFVSAIVSKDWLTRVLQCGSVAHPVDKELFREHVTRRSAESLFKFNLQHVVINFTPSQRQKLFAGISFFVHPQCTPLESPNNDMRNVVSASGGTIVTQHLRAEVLVLPADRLTSPPVLKIIKSVRSHRNRSGLLAGRRSVMFVAVEDVFCAVLRQQKLQSTISV